MTKIITKLLLIISLLINSLNSFSQVNTSENPADALYNSIWITTQTHVYKDLKVPNEYFILFFKYCIPLKAKNIIVTSKFGYRPKFKRNHNGIDLKCYIGDTIYAAFNGKVRVVKNDPKGYGNYVVLRHDNGFETIYGHMSKQLVQTNEIIKAGDAIGLGGNTGRSTGSHLHFEVRFCGIALNPADIFDFERQKLIKYFYIFKKQS